MSLSPIRLAVVAALLGSPALAQSFRVDLNADNDRTDQLTRGRDNWRVLNGESAEHKIGDVTITLRAAGENAVLASAMWKTGYDTNATIASDGAAVAGGGKLQVVLSGLPAGRHTLASVHNALDDKQPSSPISIDVGSERVVKALRPSLKVLNDYDAATAFVEFEAKAGEDVVITYSADDASQPGPIVLNALELNTPDPAHRAIKPAPADLDEHVEENPVLRWTAANGAVSHRVYLGTSDTSLTQIGETKKTEIATKDLSVTVPAYFWRVDSVDASGKVTTGEVWQFRIRRLAFPGAEGYGRFAIGGRGGKVFNVTSLEDSGPGTLREAIEAEGPRTVIFRVGGTIKLNSKLVIRNPYITLAGQTAPGDGIAVRGYTFGFYGTRDAIKRYMRIRVGDESGSTMDGTGFASTDHSIMDHCSVSWSIDEGVSSRGAKNITFQRSIVSEALNIANHAKYQAGKGHSFAGSISGEVGSYHHNLITHCAGRNWSLAGGLTRGGKVAGSLDLRNNVFYNWQHRTTDGGVKRMNFVANLYLPGPATKVFHMVRPEDFLDHDPQLYHIEQNVMEGKQYEANNWADGAMLKDKMAAGVEQKLRSPKEVFPPFVKTTPVKNLLNSVLSDVGANIPRHDAVDLRAIKDTKSRSFTFKGSRGNTPGVIDSQADVGGWPELKGGEAPADADLDGMPDWFEIKHKLNPADPADGSIYRESGYTNLETYLNWIVENGSIEPKK